MTCCRSSLTLPHSSVHPSQDWPLFMLPRALSLTASGLKLYTDHDDRLLLPEQDKVLFICLLTWFALFLHLPPCLCLYCSCHKRCPSHPSLTASRRTFQRRVLSESAFHPQHLTWKLHAMDIQLIFTGWENWSLDSQAQGMVPNHSFIHLLTHSFTCWFHFIFAESSPIGCSSYDTHRDSPVACCNILSIL